MGVKVTGLFGVVTGIDAELIPPHNASDIRDIDTVDGVAVPRNGYRNIFAPVTNQTTNKGFWWCQTYVSNTLYEGLISFDNVSGVVKPYERNYDNATDSWTRTVITGPAAAALSLHDTYWRGLSFGPRTYFWNYNDPHPFYQYTLSDFDSFIPVEPPANPTNAPTVVYYLNSGSRAYAKYIGAQAGYVAGDVTTDGTVADTVSMTGKAVKVLIKANGHFTITFKLKHSGGATDLTYNDVFNMEVTVAGDPNNLGALLGTLSASFTSSTGPVTQEVNVEVVSEGLDEAGNLKSVVLYLKFGGKGTRATWATTTELVIEGDVGDFSTNDYLLFSPLEAGGMVDWGPNDTSTRIMYTYYDASTTYESGPSLAKNLDRSLLAGVLLEGNAQFPMGSVPLVTVTAGPADYFRLYVQKQVGGKKPDAWRRVVEQLDSSVTYTYAVMAEDYAALSEYAPGGFDYQNILNGFVFKQWVVWLYRGALNNVRATRYNNAIAQATTDEAFKGDLSQDDEERGSNYTLNANFQDEPVAGTQMGNVAVIGGSKCVAVMVDTENLPKGMSPPRVVPNAPGLMGPHAHAIWTDETGTPIFIYVAKGGDSVWAVRVPNGITVDSIEAITAYKFSNLVDGSFDDKLYGGSQNRSDEAIHVYVHGHDDSLHIRYNTREIVLKRPDAIAGKRPWQFYNYDTGQWGDQWNKFQAFQWSKGWGLMAIRLNGAMDEFEHANMKDPATGGRIYEAIDASAKTPASLNAGTDLVTWTDPPPWSSGTPVKNETNGNGLTAGTQYYYNRATYITGSYHLTQADAQTGANKVNLTGVSWDAGTVTPNGPEDGGAFAVDPYWESKDFIDARRRIWRVFVDKKNPDDEVVVRVYSDRQTSDPITVAAGDRYARFGPRQSGDRHRFRFTLSERHQGVRGFSTEETELSQRRQA